MYATIEQVNTYVQTYYSSTNSLRVAWNALSVDDKNVYLNQAERYIDQLQLKGKEIVKGKAFPREMYSHDPDAAVSLEAAKNAECELAVRLCGEIETQDRLELQKRGVKSYKIGDLSETFKDNTEDNFHEYVREIVFPFLRKWLGGGFDFWGPPTCYTHVKR